MNDGPLLEAVGLGKTYTGAAEDVEAVKDVDLRVYHGSFIVVRGRSGSGKTTLLNLLGGLDRPTTGSVVIEGRDLAESSESELAVMRRSEIGFIFQGFGLIPILTATENVEVPLRLVKTPAAERRERSRILLELVGLGDRGPHRPSELSGGEQQRVAIARALANRPQLLLADEPTGQLDSRTGEGIIRLLSALVRSEGITAIVATHDPAQLAVADEVWELNDGVLTAGTTFAARR
jgi:putative ABC transport system ATP-binding protein